ncbi:MAG: hypothetical protein AB8C84_11550 [Oligoflexales bacterium]
MSKPFRLRNQSLLVVAEAPGGLYNSSQLQLIASLADGDTAMVKVTEDQRIGLFVTEEHLPHTQRKLESVGLGLRHYQDGHAQPVSCIGEMCPEHQQDALGASMDIAEQLSDLSADCSLAVGVNGCANCCVPCHTMDVSIVGDEAGYKIRIGGRSHELPELGQFLAEGIPEAEISMKVRSIVELFNKHREEEETFQEVLERMGTGPWVKALEPYSQDAAGSDDLLGLSLPSENEASDSEDNVNLDNNVDHDSVPEGNEVLGDLDEEISLDGGLDGLDEDFGEEEVSAAGGGEISDDLGEDFGEEEVSAAGGGEISDDSGEDFGEEEVPAAGGGEISGKLGEDYGEEEV